MKSRNEGFKQLLLLAALLQLVLVTARGQTEVVASLDPPTLYEKACAACHGADGAGLPTDSLLLATFKVPPADFTDPMFNSREPSADWKMVIIHGGAAMGLASEMPSYGHALTEEQIDGLVWFLKGLAATQDYPPGDLNFLRPVRTIKAFPEDEFLIINRYQDNEDSSDGFLNTIEYARRLGTRAQAEIKVSQIAEGSRFEVVEVELSLKLALSHNLENQSLWSVGLEAAIPVGDADDSETLIPYLSLAKGISDSFTVQSTFRSHLPTSTLNDGDAEFSGIVHWMTTPWPRGIFPGLEGTVAVPFSAREEVGVTLIPQVYFGLSRAGHVALTVGVEIPVTDLSYNYRIRSFLLWDIGDGPFWRGW